MGNGVRLARERRHRSRKGKPSQPGGKGEGGARESEELSQACSFGKEASWILWFFSFLMYCNLEVGEKNHTLQIPGTVSWK